MNLGLEGAPQSPPIIRGRFDPIFALRDFQISGDGRDPQDGLLQRLFDEGAGRVVVFDGPSLVIIHTQPLYIRSNTRIVGNGATIKAHPVAPFACSGLHLTSETWTGYGPSGIRIKDLRYDGSSASRRAAGVLLPYLGAGQFGQAAAFYLINAEDVVIEDCVAIDTVGDGFYMGGDSSHNSSTSAHFRGCLAKDASRNGFSFVGTQVCTASSCISLDHSYGGANNNISCGFDCEPDGSASANYGLLLSGCAAKNCATAGFAANNNAYNYSVTWADPYAQSCAIGFYADAAGGTKVFGAQYNFNTVNFSGISEKISGF
jgi:hypothetical protein